MTFEEFERRASKCSLKVILKLLYGLSSNAEWVLSDLERDDYADKSEALLRRCKEIRLKKEQLIGSSDANALKHFKKLCEEFTDVQIKLEKLNSRW